MPANGTRGARKPKATEGYWPSEISDLNQKNKILLQRINALLERQDEPFQCKCSECLPPSPKIRALDEFTGQLIKAGKLKKDKMCPYYAIDAALFDFGVYDRRAEENSFEERHREAHGELKKYAKNAADAIAEGVRLANRRMWPGAYERFENGEVPSLDDYYSGQRKRYFQQIVSLRGRLSSLLQELGVETNRHTGNPGVTQRQSLIEGFLRAWERLNGTMPGPNNKNFRKHLRKALEFVYSGQDVPQVSEDHIRVVRDRLLKKGG